MVSPRAALEQRLRAVGAEPDHDRHPFHRRLHGGGCTPRELRAWVINRFYYQSRIPMKDAALLARCPDPALRRAWRRRVEDQDGGVDEGGGLRRFLALAAAVGLDPDYVASGAGVLPATRFAVDAYVRFVAEASLLEAVASSLTELFAPPIHSERLAGLSAHYAFADETALAYFRARLAEAPRESAFGLSYVLAHAVTPASQAAAVAALVFKTDVLWAQLDALWSAYVEPGRPPPGAWTGSAGLAPGVLP